MPLCGLTTEGTHGLWCIPIHPVRDMRPGKTGLYDEAVLIDDVTIAPQLQWLIAGRPPADKVW